MISIRVEVKGSQAIVNGLQKLSASLRKGGLKEIAEAVLVSMERRIAAGEDERDRPMKALKRQDSTLLNDTGKMLAAMRLRSVNSTRAVIGFGGGFENQKAWWQHHGTKGPYPIRAKNGKALAFKTSMSFANAMGTGKRGKSRGLTMSNARSNAQGMAIVRGVMHPGLPPRPFFGISPTDEKNAQLAADSFLASAARESGL